MSKSFRAEVYPAEGSGVAQKDTPSARGLWAATGKTTKPAHEYDLTGQIVQVKGLSRKKDEFYPTPPEPTRAFLSAENVRLQAFPEIWEPAAGDGAMAREIRDAGWITCETDLVDRGGGAFVRDFYDFTGHLAPCIVTNPPFDECGTRKGARWITHALDVLGVEYMALLLNWTWPAAGGLGPLWARHPPARVYLMRWRIDFTNQGASPIQHAWFVWDKAHQGETVLRMLDKADARQSTIFGEPST